MDHSSILLFLALLLVLCNVEAATNSPPPPRNFGPFLSAEDFFTDSLGESFESLQSLEHRPLLIHTQFNESDYLVLINGENEAENYTVILQTQLYHNLQAISHLPVALVAILAPYLVEQQRNVEPVFPTDSFKSLSTVLKNTSELVNSNFPDRTQANRQLAIIDDTMEFIERFMSDSVTPTLDDLEEFGVSVRGKLFENAHDAVLQYLQCINKTITELLKNETITSEEFDHLTVIIDHPQFTEPNSFILQYYEQLLDYQYEVDTTDTERIIILPQSLYTNGCSSQNHINVASTPTSVLSKTELMHIITRVFYGQSNVYSSIHMLLSEAAENIICSPEFTFQSCLSSTSRESEELSAGFRNPIERGYVAIIIFLGTLCVVLVIVVIYILREGDIMRKERKRENPTISNQNDVIQNVNTDSVSDEDNEDSIPFQNETATDRRHFYLARKNRRFRNRSSLGAPDRGIKRNRPSVTYSEVSIHQ